MNKLVLLLAAMGLTGCTWVKLTEEGQGVRVMTEAQAECTRVGRTVSSTKASLAKVDRKDSKVATELETLARNHAARMGGNAIVADAPVTDEGSQTFIVYRCTE